MRYWMLQLFLTSRSAGTLFEGSEKTSRQGYLRQTFGQEIHFEHYGRRYVYKYFAEIDDVIAGVVAKEHTITVAGPPEEEFVSKNVSDWETANIFIDSSGADTGQKAAMQPTIGMPTNIVRSLIDHINLFAKSDWLVSANPITRAEEFWTVAEQNLGHMKEIDLSFVVPNIWGGSSETEKALKELKEKDNAQTVEVKIKNKDGNLTPQSDRIKESVEYVTKGGGTAKIKDENDAVIYTSDNEESIVTTAVDPDFPVQEAEPNLLRSMIQRIFRS